MLHSSFSFENRQQKDMHVFTTLLLGRFRSSTPFRDVFSISVALSLSAILRLSNITPGGSEAKMVGRNARRKRDNKKTLKTILSAVLSSDVDLKKFFEIDQKKTRSNR